MHMKYASRPPPNAHLDKLSRCFGTPAPSLFPTLEGPVVPESIQGRREGWESRGGGSGGEAILRYAF